MLKWKIWEGTQEAWDKLLVNAKDYNVFQSFAWGELKTSKKWSPIRYYCVDNGGNILSMAQILRIEILFGIVFLWCPGGIIFKFRPNHTDVLKEIIDSFIDEIKSVYPKSLLRFHSLAENNSKLSYCIRTLCLKPYFNINSGYTVHYRIPSSSQKIRKQMLPKHRYYTKKSSEAGITWSCGNSSNLLLDLAALYKEMVSNKKLHLDTISYSYLENLREHFRDRMFILIGYLNSEPVTCCLVLLFGDKAYYMAASTSQKGRDVSASYIMFDHLIRELGSKGITQFDFGGIDPIHKNAIGVNHYKCGFGGEIIEQLGEWEFATSEILRILINCVINFKKAVA